MSHLYPHPPYAEDQPFAYIILTNHVLLRGFQTGSLLGPFIGSAGQLYLRSKQRRQLAQSTLPKTSSTPISTTSATATSLSKSVQNPPVRAANNAAGANVKVTRVPPFWPSLVRATGTSAVITTGLMGLALVGRMWGREEIEWQDRSWRLLENRGQVEVDAFSLAGMGVGLGTAGYRVFWNGWRGVGWKMASGLVGTGAGAGVLGYVVWKYGGLEFVIGNRDKH